VKPDVPAGVVIGTLVLAATPFLVIVGLSIAKAATGDFGVLRSLSVPLVGVAGVLWMLIRTDPRAEG
jgi:hypothetical protein